MRYSLFIYLSIALLIACKTNSDHNKKTSQTGDSLKLLAPAKDSGMNPGTDGGDQQPSSQQVMAELIDMDNKVQVIDTTVLLGSDTFRIKLTHHCLHDSAVIVPVKYLKPYGLKEFITHNFVSDILVKRNDSVILNRVVSKNDFGKVEEENLLKYGILIYPYIGKVDKEKQEVTIAYSLSIPLTDVGQSVRAIVNRNGTIEFKGRGPN